MKKIKLIAIFGKSGAGKDTFLNYLLDNIEESHRVVLSTTRKKRENEENHISYHYISPGEFLDKIENHEMASYHLYNNWFYGVEKRAFDPNKLNIGVFSAENIADFKNYNSIDLYPILIQAEDKDRLLAALDRENKPDCHEICRRFLQEEKDHKNYPFERYAVLINKYDDFNNHNYIEKLRIDDFLANKSVVLDGSIL